jgi:hypothetical protein
LSLVGEEARALKAGIELRGIANSSSTAVASSSTVLSSLWLAAKITLKSWIASSSRTSKGSPSRLQATSSAPQISLSMMRGSNMMLPMLTPSEVKTGSNQRFHVIHQCLCTAQVSICHLRRDPNGVTGTAWLASRSPADAIFIGEPVSMTVHGRLLLRFSLLTSPWRNSREVTSP